MKIMGRITSNPYMRRADEGSDLEILMPNTVLPSSKQIE